MISYADFPNLLSVVVLLLRIKYQCLETAPCRSAASCAAGQIIYEHRNSVSSEKTVVPQLPVETPVILHDIQ